MVNGRPKSTAPVRSRRSSRPTGTVHGHGEVSEATLAVVILRSETDRCVEERRVEDDRVDLAVLAARISSQRLELLDDVEVVLPSEKLGGDGGRVNRHDECSYPSAENSASGRSRVWAPEGKPPTYADPLQGAFALAAQLLQEQIPEHDLLDLRQVLSHPGAVTFGVERLRHLDGHERQPHGPGLRLGDLDRSAVVRHGTIDDGGEELARATTRADDDLEGQRRILPAAPGDRERPIDGDIGPARHLSSPHGAKPRRTAPGGTVRTPSRRWVQPGRLIM